MAYQNLNKLFVRVPASVTADQITSIIADSKNTYKSKIYFLEGKNQIVNNGITYGIDPSTAQSISDLQQLVGGKKLETGAKSVIQRLEALEAIKVATGSETYLHIANDSNGTPNVSVNIVGIETGLQGLVDAVNAKKYIDKQVLDVSTKARTTVSASDGITVTSTTNADGHTEYAVGADLTINYVASTEDSSAHITLTNGDKTHTFGSIPVSDIIKNGVLQGTSYDKNTGILSLTFNEADGSAETYKIDLHEMLDINDMKINANSSTYLAVSLNANSSTSGENDGSQAVFSALIQDVSTADATHTGLVDAYQAKQYILSQTTNLHVDVESKNSYIDASVDPDNNKKVNIAANISNLTATAGAAGEYDDDGEQATAPVAATLSGTAGKLVDSADAAAKVKTYVDGAIAIEGARSDAKNKADIKVAIEALDANVNSTGGTNVAVNVVEADGVVTTVNVTESYATITGDSSTFTVPSGDVEKMVKAKDLNTLRTYIDGKSKDLAVEAEGDSYVTANVPADNNKKVKVSTNVAEMSFVQGTNGSDSSLTGVANKLVDNAEAANKVSSFVNARISEEVAKLDGTAQGSDSSYISIEVVEADGKLTTASVTTTYGSIADSYVEGIATT